MRKILTLAFLTAISFNVFSQDAVVYDTVKPVSVSRPKRFDITSRAGDHIMIQAANNLWNGAPDSISKHVNGFSRSANFYIMLDKPFKSNPQWSVAIGVGIGTSAIYMKNMTMGIDQNTPRLAFTATDTTNHYNKYKFTTTYAEAPLELRFTARPDRPTSGFKAAVGVKVGTLLAAKTKGVDLKNRAGSAISNTTYKIKDNDYLNKTRLGVSARAGYGNFSIFGTYYFSSVFKDGVAAPIKNIQFGLTLSGL